MMDICIVYEQTSGNRTVINNIYLEMLNQGVLKTKGAPGQGLHFLHSLTWFICLLRIHLEMFKLQ